MTQLSVCLTAFILICSCLLPLTAAAQKTDPVIPAQAGIQTSSSESADTIDFSKYRISEPAYVKFWKLQIQDTLRSVEIDSALSVPEVIFHHSINFSTARFDSTADFRGATFESTAYFIAVTFNSTAEFRRATFDRTADFSWATFGSRADFRGATFEGKADFWVATFDATADFSRANFDSTAHFSEATFGDTADFGVATFDSSAGFSGAIFEGRASFWATKFKSTAIFSRATFEKAADFRSTKFLGKVDFGRVTLPDSMDFRNVTEITRKIDFTYCLPPEKERKCRIALEGTDISKIKLNMNLFELSFPEETVREPTGETDTIYKESLDVIDTVVRKIVDTIIYPTYDQQCSIYEQVGKKLENDGFMESYEILDIEYRKFKSRHKGGLSWYVADTFQDWWWNYGYTKERVFFWMLGFWFVFSFANLALYHRLSEGVYAIPFLDRWDYDRMTWPKRWIWYWLQVVTYTAVVFFGLKMDVAKFRQAAVRSHPWLFSYLMSIYVVGLVCLGFIVNIIFTR